jgi:hypothetical protein
MRPFEGLTEQPAFVFCIGGANALVSLMLGSIAYMSYTMHRTGVAVFAASGAILTVSFTIRYFRDAWALMAKRRKAADRPFGCRGDHYASCVIDP